MRSLQLACSPYFVSPKDTRARAKLGVPGFGEFLVEGITGGKDAHEHKHGGSVRKSSSSHSTKKSIVLKGEDLTAEQISNGKGLTLEDIVSVARNNAEVTIPKTEKADRSKRASPRSVSVSKAALREVALLWRIIHDKAEHGGGMYGVTTGVGGLHQGLISPEEASKLSSNLVLSHACGLGANLPPEVVRAIMLLLANSLAKGHTVIRPSTLQALVDMLNSGITPEVPEIGSVGSSGDLAPLAHIALALIGHEDSTVDYLGQKMSAKEALEKAGLQPVLLEPGEGLALLNGTQVMTAIGALAIYDAQRTLTMAQISAALAVEVLKGDLRAFDPFLFAGDTDHPGVRPHPGMDIIAANMIALTRNSEILRQKNADTQSPYSLRTIPQVMGPIKHAFDEISKTLEIEMNSCTGNPIFEVVDGPNGPETRYISGGNFHGQVVAFAMDDFRLRLSKLISNVEERVSRLMDAQRNKGLPPFLIRHDPGLNSGLMIAHYTLAGIVAEAKMLKTAVSDQSVTTSAGQEDDNSMGTISARYAAIMVRLAQNAVGIETMCVCQGYDFRQPLKLGDGTWAAYSAVREIIDSRKYDSDGALFKDMNLAIELASNGHILSEVEKVVKLAA